MALRSADGLGAAELLATVSSRDQGALRAAVAGAIGGEQRSLVAHFRRYDGAERTLEVRARPLFVDGAGAGAIATFEDITERSELQAELRHLADTDPLTGLANRRRVLDELGHALSADRGIGQLAVLVAVCPGTTPEDAVRLAARALEGTPQMRESDPRPAGPGFSIGIVMNDGSADVTADQLLARSDQAMYTAKKAGGGRWAVYDPDLGTTVSAS